MIAPVDERLHDDNAMTSGVGADLRGARERLGWQLEDVAAGLRIRYSYLLAIEEGRIDVLPGNAYAVGFLRTYATSLGLDPDEMTRRFRSEARDINRKPNLEFPAPVADRGIPTGAVVLLGVLLAIGAYIGWYRMSGERPGTVAVPDVPARLAPLAEAGKPPPPQAATASADATPTSPEPAPPPLPASVPPTSAAAALPPRPAPPAVTAGSEPEAAPIPPPPGLAASSLAAPGLVNNPDDGRIMLRAHADSWVQVHDKQGQILLNRVLRPGETWQVPARQPLMLTTGNAGGVDLVVDGVVAPSLGGTGVVRRDMPLDADIIKDGKLPAQLAAAASVPSTHPAAPLASPAPASQTR
jgi:cytoskeleton protein RodZ